MKLLNHLMQTDSDNTCDTDDSSGLEVFADLRVSLDSLTEEMKTKRRDEQRRINQLPRYVPKGYALQLNSSGQGLQALGTPQPGREWIIRELTAVDSNYQTLSPSGANATGAAGAATSVQLNAGTITGFDVSVGPASAAGTATVTLSNVVGGPYTYTIDELTTNSEFLSKALTLGASGGIPTLAISAVASGGTVSLNLYGTVGQTQTDVTWYIGQLPNGSQTTPLSQNLVIARMHGIPAEITKTADVWRVLPNQQLIIGGMSGPANEIIIGKFVILDQPQFAERGRISTY